MPTQWINSHEIMQLLASRKVIAKPTAKLPEAGFDVVMLPLRKRWTGDNWEHTGPMFPVFCEPAAPKKMRRRWDQRKQCEVEVPVKVSTHRVKVHCSCRRKIPFGRMQQHLHTEMRDGKAVRVPAYK